MKTILEQNFEEMYNLVKERALKCIQPVDQLDTFTKFMMFETLNQILLEVFGESRYMYLIKVTDTAFVVSFLDRYKIDQTKSLVVPFVDVFEFPDKDTLLNMSLEELENFRKRATQCGIMCKDISIHYNMQVSWFNSILRLRQNGAKPSRQKFTPHAHNQLHSVKLVVAMVSRLEKYGIPLIFKLTPCNAISEKRLVRNALKSRNNNRTDYYDELISSVDQKELDNACIVYCQAFHDTIDAMVYEDKHTNVDLYQKSAVSRVLNLNGAIQTYFGGSYTFRYNDSDIQKLKNIDQKLTQLVNDIKGGKND